MEFHYFFIVDIENDTPNKLRHRTIIWKWLSFL